MHQLSTQKVTFIYTCYWSHMRYRVMSRWHPMIRMPLHITELIRLRKSNLDCTTLYGVCTVTQNLYDRAQTAARI